MGYERDAIGRMKGYLPGKQPDAGDAVKLNTNENPYPPCAAVMAALGEIEAESLRRYPPPRADAFRLAAAEIHAVAPENIVCTNGGDELLRMAITTFVDPGRPVGMIDPGYSLYPVLAEIHGSPIIRVEADQHWLPPPDFARRLNGEGAGLSFLVNPHAPSGRLITAASIAELAAELQGVLLVDEAYVDFVDPEQGHDLVPLVRRFDNLLLLRTLSKGYSLAGLRFGYGIGDAKLVAPLLYKTRDSYNLDAVAQKLATVALRHREEARATWNRVRAERDSLSRSLRALGFEVGESQSNFLLARLSGGGPEAAEVHRELERKGIYIRYFDEPRLRDALRITVGTAEQNRRLLFALRSILGR